MVIFNNNNNNNNNNDNNNNNKYLYSTDINIAIFHQRLKIKIFQKKNYHDCIKYICIKCMNLPKSVKTILLFKH